jgi:hypothetical protein
VSSLNSGMRSARRRGAEVFSLEATAPSTRTGFREFLPLLSIRRLYGNVGNNIDAPFR